MTIHRPRERAPSRLAATVAAALFLLVQAVACAPRVEYDITESRRLVREASAAREAGDTDLFIARLDSAVAFRSDHPGLVHALAAARAEAGDADRALALLERLAAWGYATDPGADERFASLAGDPRFRRARETLLRNGEPRGTATVAFHLTDPLTLPEGLALDSVTGRVILSAVHRRTVSVVALPGHETVLVDGRVDGLAAPLGMAVDPVRRTLWVSSAALPEIDPTGAEPADGAVRAYDLDSGRLRREVRLPPESGAAPGDLALDNEGGVWVSDWRSGSLLRIRGGATTFEVVLPAGTLGSPQGLVVDREGSALWVADWALGLVRVDPVAGTATRVEAPGTTLIGSDALLRLGQDLVVVQNGFAPARVLRLDLDGEAVDRVSVLLSAHEAFKEPTGAVIAENTLLLVANGQWGRFADGMVPDPATVEPPVILAVPLVAR